LSLLLLVPLSNVWPSITFAFVNGTEGCNKSGPPGRREPNEFFSE
jgi:hypothetical protein